MLRRFRNALARPLFASVELLVAPAGGGAAQLVPIATNVPAANIPCPGFYTLPAVPVGQAPSGWQTSRVLSVMVTMGPRTRRNPVTKVGIAVVGLVLSRN